MERFVIQHISKLAVICYILFAVQACKKSNATINLQGNYKGSYTFSEGGFAYWHGSGTSSVTITDDTFTSTNLVISPVTPSTPVTANLNYTLAGDSILFLNKITPPGTGQNTTAATVGKYQYHFEGDSLILTGSYSSGELSTFSQYRLKRN
jgi:hypothetical protein